MKSLPFHIPEPYKRYPFRATPPRASISHHREYPPLFGLPTRTIFKNVVGYDAHHAKNEKPHVLPQQLWRRGWIGVCKSADPLWYIHHIRPSTFALNPKSGQKYFNYAQSPKSGPKKLMNPQPCNRRIRKSVKISLWIRNLGKNSFKLRWYPLEDWITNCRQSGMFTGAKKKKNPQTTSHFSRFLLCHLGTRFSRTAVIKRELSANETTHSLAAKLLTQSAKWLRKLATFF